MLSQNTGLSEAIIYADKQQAAQASGY